MITSVLPVKSVLSNLSKGGGCNAAQITGLHFNEKPYFHPAECTSVVRCQKACIFWIIRDNHEIQFCS